MDSYVTSTKRQAAKLQKVKSLLKQEFETTTQEKDDWEKLSAKNSRSLSKKIVFMSLIFIHFTYHTPTLNLFLTLRGILSLHFIYISWFSLISVFG